MTTDTQRTVRFIVPQTAELASEPPPGADLGPTQVAGRTLVSLVSAGTELACYRGLISAGSRWAPATRACSRWRASARG